MAEKKDECIQVVVRCRPFNNKEKTEGRTNIIDIDLALRQVQIRDSKNLKDDPKSFTFDGAYDENTQQKIFYEESCFGLVESVLEGFNGTIFAYGQTGCGKSWTMQGPPSPNELRGVIPNSFAHIFEYVKASTDCQFLIRCSYLEIYNEKIKDLLCDQKTAVDCELKEDPGKGVFVKGLSDVVVDSEADIQAQLDKGLSFRTIAATLMNAESSRSHSIFTIIIEMSTVDKDSGKEIIKAGKLNLVDLAGSERQKKTGATGAQLKEGTKINLSLSALGNVISALSENKGKHIPYRDSKLTRLLQDSLGGNTKTLMVAAISPADYNYDETMSTLRYANRAKNIKNKPKINEDPKDAMLREFKDEIEKLRQLLAAQQSGGIQVAGSISTQAGDFNMGHQNSTPEIIYQEKIIEREKIVHVEVEKVPTEHLNLHKALIEEHASANKLLRQSQEQIAEERRLREELLERLQKLQGHVVGHHIEPTISNGAVTGAVETESEKKDKEAERIEREQAQKNQKERRLKLKKRKEERQQAELKLVVEEKLAMEDELEELRVKASNGESVTAAAMEKKLQKMKKKYEKKIISIKAEADFSREDFDYQRQQLLDTIEEQDKDVKLFETIALSALGDKELKRVVDKSRWSEDEFEWIIPCVKKKNIDHTSTSIPSQMSSSIDPHSKFSARGILPSSLQNQSILPNINLGQPKYEHDVGLQSSRLPSRERSRGDDRKVKQKDEFNQGRNSAGGIGYFAPSDAKENYKDESSSGNKSGIAIPILSLQNLDEGDKGLEKKKKKKKKKVKKPVNLLPDEAGSGETAGAISDWGFALEGAETGMRGEKEPEYSDDDDFEADDDDDIASSSRSGKSHSSFNSNAPSKPPIGKIKPVVKEKIPAMPNVSKNSARSPRFSDNALPVL